MFTELERTKSIQEIEIIKSWYEKDWISLNEFTRLLNLIF